MAVIASGRPSREPSTDVHAFAEEADRAAETFGAGWAPIRIEREGRVLVVDDTAQSIGAFKLRGAVIAVAELRDQGVEHVALASSGSFGMACATAARDLGLSATVFMPADASAGKQQAIAALGGRVEATRPTYEEAKADARVAGDAPGSRFLDGVGPGVYRGNASLARAVVESGLLAVSGAAVVVPLGIGSLAVPTALYLAGAGYACDLVVVEPLTHCKYLASLGGEAVPDGRDTLADGAAVGLVPPESAAILDSMTSAAIAVSEPEIASAIRHLWCEHEIRAEGAGALSTAAVRSAPEHFEGYEQVWTFVTGRNIDDDRFSEIVG